mmetsp:Transcript_18515/g.45284  ORF Transcript_18515/g.45284 Transcript_18515/m.45284 type:complete len:237 (+) Transcript_18515:3-713(+)
MYKYYSYRFMWTGDMLDQAVAAAKKQGWVGAGVPHGVIPIANFLSMPAINEFLNVDFVGAPASVVFHTPFLRYLTIYGAVDVSAKSLKKATLKGTCVGLVGDGIAGIFSEGEVVALKNRKGLARFALKNGVTLIPAYSMGNTAIMTALYDSAGIMESLSRKLRMSFFIPVGRWGTVLPRRANVSMLLGPLVAPEQKEDPSQEEIDAVHQQLLDGIEGCFNTHRGAHGWPDRQFSFA